MWRYRSPGPFDLRPWCLPPLFGWTRPSAPRVAFCPGGPIDRESAELVLFGFCCRSDRSISTIAGPLHPVSGLDVVHLLLTLRGNSTTSGLFALVPVPSLVKEEGPAIFVCIPSIVQLHEGYRH